MSSIYFNWFAYVLWTFNINSLLYPIIASLVLWYTNKIFNFQRLLKGLSVTTLIRFILVYSLLIGFIFTLITTLMYYEYLYEYNVSLIYATKFDLLDYFDYSINLFNIYNLKFSLDAFGLLILILAYLVGVISLLCLDTRLFWKNIRFSYICNVIVFFVIILVSVNDLISFFIAYEGLLIPSFVIVYFVSPTRRAIQASLYFLIWTQIGSFLVLCAVAYIVFTTGFVYFDDIYTINFSSWELYFLYALLFFGFGFKIPIWPFHHWLTKTHVEAPAGFSIYLSGFLVKSAIFGFYKISNLLGGELDTTLFSIFAFLGVVDASFKMWGQTDLKKLVAFSTVQEMSMIYLVFTWGDVFATYGGLLFCVTHAFLSALFFFLVDCIQRRYHSRSILEINGIFQHTPNLALAILFSCIFYSGLPGTIKFITEFYILAGLVETAPYMTVILVFMVNFIGLIGFSKCWFNVVFGLSPNLQSKKAPDLTYKESLIITYCFYTFISLSFVISYIL